MWKIFIGFVAFAALALFVLMKAGDKANMQGEAAGHAPAVSEPAASTPPASK
jgi:hypothetical protein